MAFLIKPAGYAALALAALSFAYTQAYPRPASERLSIKDGGTLDGPLNTQAVSEVAKPKRPPTHPLRKWTTDQRNIRMDKYTDEMLALMG
ncbi:hypothetical protein BJ742DRAFT_772783 [Cladochytrium replicatum]|nr:hypothetical protein BJ742DRAFT_772783 [Cladochytrium replicatum]